MAVRDIFKVTRKTFFNPAAWIDIDSIADQNRTIFTILKSLFSRPTPPARTETFEKAIKRLQLTEKDVQYGATNYRLFALIFLLCGLGLLFYSFYLLFHHAAFIGCFLGIAASCLFFAQAFQYDFWSLQMRRRKLGLSFDEWLQSIVGGKDASK